MFLVASEMQVHKLKINGPILQILDGEISEFQRGVNVITTKNIKEIHKALHWTMVDAYKQNVPVILVDIANMLNPHMFPSITRNANDVLRNISIARPFQMYQCISIINTLINDLLYGEKEGYLVIVTALDSQIRDNENKDEFMTNLLHILFGLQRIAVRGNTVLITNKIRKYQKLFTANSNLHVEIRDKVKLLKHPNR